MDKQQSGTKKSHQQLFHFDEHNIEQICASLENEIENLKVVKNQNQPFKTPDVQHFEVTLYETETMTLLDLPSLVPSFKNSSQTPGIKVTENPKYLLSDAAQSSKCFQRTHYTQTEPIALKDQSNVASIWLLQKDNIGDDTQFETKQELKWNNFKEMLFISDRIVTSNIFSKNQIEFITQHCIDKSNAMSYRYILEEILQFSCDKLKDLTVTSFMWNPMNEDILAVGYGKWNDETQNVQGAVCCWSLKNPVYPERKYEFNKPITSLDFSKTHSNILIAGSYGGFIYTLDITDPMSAPIIINGNYLQNFPVWSVVSFLQKSYTSEDEFILSVDGNGSIRKWSTASKTFISEQTSLIFCGVRNNAANMVRTSETHESTIVHNMAGTTISFHPTKKSTYLIGTKVGLVMQNTIDSRDCYDRIFTAHNGPIYGVKYSPFCSSVFMTYGADWKIKIWMDDFESPLLSLCYSNTVDDADWSPISSTVLVSVSGAVICIWDFARKTVEPIMTFACKTGVRFSLVKFSKYGNNIVTGDINGQIRCFHIRNMPSPNFLQKISILTALANVSSNQKLEQIIKKTMLNDKQT